jgi:hypothetical protein
VLGTSVVVVQHPLQALQVLHEHLSLELCALRCGHILLELSLIIESLRLDRVPRELLNQIGHKLQVLLTVLVNNVFLGLDLGIQGDTALLLLQLIDVDLRLIDVTYLIVRDVIGAQVTEILFLNLVDNISEELDLDFLRLDDGIICRLELHESHSL